MRIRELAAAGLALVLVTVGATAGAADAASPKEKVRAWRQAHEKEILADFSTLLAMPNVATTLADVDRNAAYIQGLLQQRGFETKLLRAAPGTPASVFGELKVPGARRTVTFYAHYDGQPVGQKGWISSPFEPSMRTALPEARPVDWKAAPALDPNWRLFARAAGDDKGSIQALLSAFDALKAAGIKPTVNIKLLYEGEEEQGSPHFAGLVAQNLETVRGDLLIMGDGPMSQTGKQQINFGNRGIVGFKATVYGPLKPLHDGHYGSWAPSPTVMIAGLVTSLRNDNGDILIPGIYDDVKPVSAADKAALAALPDVETGLKQALGLGRNVGPARLADGYMRPTLNVRAVHGGDDAPSAANAIATEANASFDFRLAPGETPQRVRGLTEAYLVKQGWFIVRDTPDLATRLAHPKILRVEWDPGESIATESPMESPAAQAVAGSISRTVGYPVLRLPFSGASSGMAEIVNQLKAPMVGVSIANYDDNQHAQNENLRLGNLWDGIEVYAGLLADLDW
ncbi:M20/M25/M40 family metallo-hydrolase [Phenylobacterium sp.]|uniref:M20/M25/M40 family metallo-hydrolase n=1 Tax=Phenylobacterium sp. TaxID=1871053 RepID=UPI0011F93C2D|nr:M20/M25/M40 family metallo-hydrolase [Phenylobacterium sp.]THD64774.1 MAG: M20/M25/M40 family metallo-hydrolase [Phenylobacterium sp.]